MFLNTKRLVSIVASTALLSFVSAAANAQTNVLVWTEGLTSFEGPQFGEYTFNTSLILNSIGFATFGDPNDQLSYFIDGVEQSFTKLELTDYDTDGIRWLNLVNPTLISANSVVRVVTNGGVNETRVKMHSGVDQSINVSFSGSRDGNAWSNSNLKVSEPGSNVAPEPGSFALALTGGAALIGICIRRRRNAA